MYVEFVRPTKQIIVSNGKTIWMYACELNQVVKQEISDKSGKRPYFLEFERSFKIIADNFNTQFIREEKINGKDTYVIEFIPKQNLPGDFKMIFWVSKDLWLPLQTKITDTNSSDLLVIFKDIRINKSIDSSIFEFKIPQGVEVIEARLFE